MNSLQPTNRFLAAFIAGLLVSVGLIVATHAGLARAGLLPPPPVVATSCIDSKFEFLRNTDLSRPQIVALGSSATWRNLDMRVFQGLTGKVAVNAAPCYLHVDQAAELLEFMLPRLRRLETVITVLHPRDFERCSPRDTRFFDPRLLGAYLDGSLPAWVLYATGFRPMRMARELINEARGQPNVPPNRDDGLGSNMLILANRWDPPLQIDPRCFGGLDRLIRQRDATGFKLVIALMPVERGWGQRWDPEGRVLDDWSRRILATAAPGVDVIDFRQGWAGVTFADPVHLLADSAKVFTELIALETIRRARTH
jgi:hypothetical protein